MNIWEGIYKSFKDVPQKGNPFNSKRWVSSVTKKTNLVRSKIDRPSNQSVLPLIVSLIPKNQISIFDFGGGMGADFINCLNATDKKLNYEILENEKITEVGKESIEKINFINSPAEISSGHFDIFHCNSSIQYVQNPSSVISSVIEKISPNFISFEDLPTVEVDSFVTAQNYYNSTIPCWFFNKFAFVKLIEKMNYKLIYESKNFAKILDSEIGKLMNNFPEKYRCPFTKNFIFKNIRLR